MSDRIGDHQAIKCEIACKVFKAAKFEKVEIRNHCKQNIKHFVSFLSSESDYSQLLECEDVEAVTDGLNSHLEQAYITHFPKKTIKRHEKFIDKPSTELLGAISSTKSAFSEFKKLEKKTG